MDRLSSGMRGAFGKPYGTAARVDIGQAGFEQKIQGGVEKINLLADFGGGKKWLMSKAKSLFKDKITFSHIMMWRY